jgi:hypothetical protein
MINRLEDAPLNSAKRELLETLKDIVNKVRIGSDFCINHPDYELFELPIEVKARFQQVPQELRDKYLGRRLMNFLHGIYYNGSMQSTLIDSHSGNSAPNLENNTHMGVDIRLYTQLHANNTGVGYFDPGWHLIKQEVDGSLAVMKDGLMLHLNREQHLLAEEQMAVEGDVVSVRMPKNLIQHGFYVAVSNVGPSIDGTAEIYFNINSEGAFYLMENLTDELNRVAIPFTLKALYNPSEYECCDPLTLRFSRDNYTSIREILQSVYIDGSLYFQPETPLFTKRLAPGLALAEEPEDTRSGAENFGQNRCLVIADGLLEARQQGDETAEGRMKAILYHLSLHKISLERPYLNPHSEDIYNPLELTYQ